MADVRLQVLIVAYGRAGIESIASRSHPRLPGVEYIVSWQYADDEPRIPDSLLQRDDFKVFPTPTRGVARNRNLALEKASAPWILSSDDDVDYSREQLLRVLDAFESHPDADFMIFKYHSDDYPHSYPPREMKIGRKSPRGLSYVGGIEMGWRLDAINRAGIRFNEWFGIGGEFCAGEEDLFFHLIRKKRLTAYFVPVEICTHNGSTTSERLMNSHEYIRTKGACLRILHPVTWPLRMVTHALRASNDMRRRKAYCKSWLTGVRDLRRLKKYRRKNPE